MDGKTKLIMETNLKECICYKAHINGRCEACRNYHKEMVVLSKEVMDLIQKYPNEVNQLIYS